MICKKEGLAAGRGKKMVRGLMAERIRKRGLDKVETEP